MTVARPQRAAGSTLPERSGRDQPDPAQGADALAEDERRRIRSDEVGKEVERGDRRRGVAAEQHAPEGISEDRGHDTEVEDGGDLEPRSGAEGAREIRGTVERH